MALDLKQNQKDRLAKYFESLIKKDPSKKETINQIEIMIRTMYDQNHRFYHNIKHINHCLKHLHNYCKSTGYNPEDNCNIIKFAIVTHDIIYSSGNDGDEIHSVFVAKTMINQLGAKVFCDQPMEDIGNQIESMIFVTSHAVAPSFRQQDNCEEAIIADCDLAILGSSPEIYDKYSKYIRKEYKDLREDYFVRTRHKFLNQIAAKDNIYWTEYFQDTYGRQARENIKRTLDEINYQYP